MHTILIIEDDATIRSELKILLEKYSYIVTVVEDFTSTATIALSANPHLILLDLNLPIFDGYHVCREIRKHSNVPIIVVTSRNSDIDELMSMNFGADDFVTKPYNTQILLARISAVLARTYSTAESSSLTFGTIHLDIRKSIVSCDQNCADLTKNEMRILALLMKCNGEIVSRDELMNELWQSDEFVDDNTLTVNINRLRNKLTEIGASDVLKTKRGLGYLLWK